MDLPGLGRLPSVYGFPLSALGFPAPPSDLAPSTGPPGSLIFSDSGSPKNWIKRIFLRISLFFAISLNEIPHDILAMFFLPFGFIDDEFSAAGGARNGPLSPAVRDAFGAATTDDYRLGRGKS